MIVTDRTPPVRHFRGGRPGHEGTGGEETGRVLSPRISTLSLSLTPAREYLLLAAITLLAAALRFYKLGEWSFWIDELYTVQGAHYIADWPISRLPLHILATHWAMQAFGTSEWSARLVPATLGVLTIPALYFAVRRLCSPAVALTAMLLLAVAPWHIYWSQNARFYTTLLLLHTLALFTFYFALERHRLLQLIGSLVLFLVATREKFLGIFFVPIVTSYVLGLWVLRLPQPPGLNRRLVLPVTGLIALVMVIDGARYALGARSIWVSSVAVIQDTFFGHPIDTPARLLILIIFNIGVPLTVLALFGAAHLLMNRSRAGVLLAAGAVVPPLLLAAVNPFAFTVDRYVFLVLPCWLILAAHAVVHLYRCSPAQGRLLVVGVLAMLLADAAGSHLAYFQLNNGNRLDWRGTFAYVSERQERGDVVASTWPELGQHYTQAPVVSLGTIDPETLTAGTSRYWFVVDSEAIWFFPGELKAWIEAHATLKDVLYLRTRENLNLRVYLYDPGVGR